MFQRPSEMFEAPRPISHAPTHAHFKPSATANHVTPFAQSGQQAQSQQHATPSHSLHPVAVPLPVSNTHRPIAINAHRGNGSGGNSTAAVRALHFVSRVQTADPMTRHDSPSSVSPSVHSASASPAIHMSHPGAIHPVGMGVGFSLSTPSPPPNSFPTTETTPIPSSPMTSPYIFGMDHRDRRDSVDDNEQASAHLQGILWRNAATLRAAVSGRHPQTPQFGPQAQQGSTLGHGHASPARQGMSPLGASFSRSIPIAKRTGATMPLQPSILGQMQHEGDPLGASQAHAYANASREGSRRGSGSNIATSQSTIHSGTSPLAGTSLGSSFILAHTPPVRAGNPLDRDSRFSPAQQAEYLIKQQSEHDMLPMMMAHHQGGGRFTGIPPYPQANSVHQSPVQRSTLSLSLAARQWTRAATNNGPIQHQFGSPQLSYQNAHVAPPTLETVEDEESFYPKLSCTL